MNIQLSMVIPAYDEAQRLPVYLHAIRRYFQNSAPGEYEVIVVDDGSHDFTADIVERLFEDWDELSVLRQPVNRGKGAAVRAGVLAARGNLVLFTDADGATPIEGERKLRAAILNGADVAIGSRHLKESRATLIRRRGRRDLLGRFFALLARTYVRAPVRDVQCGFKMFRNDAAGRLFGACAEDGYLFDVFILALADRLGYQIGEVAVPWSDVPGSKIHLVRDSWRMLTGLPRIRRAVESAAAREAVAGPAHVVVTPQETQEQRDGPDHRESVRNRSPLGDSVCPIVNQDIGAEA